MRIGLINIGDEILAGKILNTNARDLALWLASLGHELSFALTLPDDVRVLVNTIRRIIDETPPAPAFPSAGASPMAALDMLILSGGLGPTRDDLTREALARYLGVSLEANPQAAAWLGEFLGRAIGAEDPQIQVPHGATPLCNPAGTACGIRFDRDACSVFAFPGVPREFKTLFDLHCRPLLERRDAQLLRRRLITFGLGETRQRELLKNLEIPAPFRFSSLPAESEVTISIEGLADASRLKEQEAVLDKTWQSLLSLLPEENVVDPQGASLPETVFRLLRDRRATVTVAESCTGGAVGHLLTEIPGSSAVFREGYLTYSNEAKTKLLGVPEAVLQAHGAVSEETALAMARGARAAAGSNYAVAVTGIAGPDGGSTEKPVGLVYIAVAGDSGETCARFLFTGNREMVRRKSSRAALNNLRLLILKDLEKQK
jgi:nicotinamide-nucleotide amidase